LITWDEDDDYNDLPWGSLNKYWEKEKRQWKF
jgi:hypothetical protein